MQVQDLRNMWREIWWGMAEGVKSEYDTIKSTSVFEYWKLFDLWRERVNRERDEFKHKTQANGK